MKRQTKTARPQTDEAPEERGAQRQPQAPTPEQIQNRAYEIFEARGSAPGHDWDDWLVAEAELKAGIDRQRGNPAM